MLHTKFKMEGITSKNRIYGYDNQYNSQKYKAKMGENEYDKVGKPLIEMKKCRPGYGHSRGTMQHRRSCQNFCSIHVYVLPTAAEYVQHHVRFVNVQSSLPENVVFSVCAH